MKVDSTKTVETKFKQLRKAFFTGKTRDYEYRKTQLRNLAKGVEAESENICKALKKDLCKDKNDCYIAEIISVVESIKHLEANLELYLETEIMETPVQCAPGRSKIIQQAMGTSCIIGAWNFPFVTTLKPFANSIAAGNVALIKPSEIAEASSAVLRTIVEDYLDNECYKAGTFLHPF